MPTFLKNPRLLGIVLLAVLLLVFAGWWQSRDAGAGAYLAVLGIAQDGGRPHIGCAEECCTGAWADGHRDLVSCLALVDPASGRRWIFDATPDFPEQVRLLDQIAPRMPGNDSAGLGVDGIFLTHAHIGHYTGLMYLGREAMDAAGIPVYALGRMREFLSTNGPWDQLVGLQNIEILALQPDRVLELGGGITVTPWLVPHRDEYSETAGFLIATRRGKALYLPDIDKWDRWPRKLAEVLEDVDYAFIDATFFSAAELPGRDLEEIPHPTIEETMKLLASIPERDRRKIRFIHLNHSNPAIERDSDAYREVRAAAMDVAEQGAVYRFD